MALITTTISSSPSGSTKVPLMLSSQVPCSGLNFARTSTLVSETPGTMVTSGRSTDAQISALVPVASCTTSPPTVSMKRSASGSSAETTPAKGAQSVASSASPQASSWKHPVAVMPSAST